LDRLCFSMPAQPRPPAAGGVVGATVTGAGHRRSACCLA
jgi:hypothetical protein